MKYKIALWIKIIYTLFLCVLVPFYWYEYGPANFLWYCDMALFVMLLAVWMENSLFNSMVAVGILPLEVAWAIDYFARLIVGSHVIYLTPYMFDHKIHWFIRGLSFFHLALPVLIIWMLYKLKYDRRAFWIQTILVWVIIIVTYFIHPKENINWVYGWGTDAKLIVYQFWHIILVMLILPFGLFLPTHWILRKFCNKKNQ